MSFTGCCTGAMAASEAAAAGPAALTSGAPAVPAAARGAAAASGLWEPPGRLKGNRPRHAAARQQSAGPAPPAGELIQPSVSELSRAVRTNILCTVRGCGKILPNSPALNMHLVKSHRLQVSAPRNGTSPGLAPTKRLARGRGRESGFFGRECAVYAQPPSASSRGGFQVHKIGQTGEGVPASEGGS